MVKLYQVVKNNFKDKGLGFLRPALFQSTLVIA